MLNSKDLLNEYLSFIIATCIVAAFRASCQFEDVNGSYVAPILRFPRNPISVVIVREEERKRIVILTEFDKLD